MELSNKTADIPVHRKECHEEDGACSWGKYKNLVISQMPKLAHIAPYIRWEHFDKFHGQKKVRKNWDPHFRWEETSRCIKKISVSKTVGNRTWALRRDGQPRDIQEQERNRISSSSRSPSQAPQRSSTTRATHSTKKHQRKKAARIQTINGRFIETSPRSTSRRSSTSEMEQIEKPEPAV